MQGISPYPQSGPEARENWRVTNDAVDDLYFIRDFGPDDGTAGLVTGTATAAVIAPQSVSGTPSIAFPATAGGRPAWRVNFRRRPRWQRAGLRLRLQYTALAGSTNNFAFQIILRSWSAGSVMPGQTDLASGILTFPGPAVAQTAVEYVYTNATAVVPGNLAWLTLFLIREKVNAADTNVNSLHVTGLSFEVLPL